MSFDVTAVLRHAGALQRATTLDAVVRATHEAITSVTRYRRSWLAVFVPEQPDQVRIVQVEGPELPRLSAPTLIPRRGDAMIEEIERAQRPVVVLDARTDPRTNKALVAQYGNRTIINLAMPAGGELVGVLGVGTYADEGVLEPTPRELEALEVYAAQLGSALARIRLLEAQQGEVEARRALERRLEVLQRVELFAMLASGVSHDLNNCLAVISSNLRSVDVSQLGEDDREALRDSADASARAIDVVTSLRKLGLSRAGRREDLDLARLVADTLTLVRPAMPRTIKVVHEAGAAPLVAGDPEQLEHALASLFLQARDAAGEGGTVRVRVDEQALDERFVAQHGWARPGRFARVVVHDTGPALAPETLSRLADPHYLKLALTGPDLGLAVISRVVQQHLGLFSCESVPGEGTRVALYLPAAALDAET